MNNFSNANMVKCRVVVPMCVCASVWRNGAYALFFLSDSNVLISWFSISDPSKTAHKIFTKIILKFRFIPLTLLGSLSFLCHLCFARCGTRGKFLPKQFVFAFSSAWHIRVRCVRVNEQRFKLPYNQKLVSVMCFYAYSSHKNAPNRFVFIFIFVSYRFFVLIFRMLLFIIMFARVSFENFLSAIFWWKM